jgi:uncharacterized membrane protein YccC
MPQGRRLRREVVRMGALESFVLAAACLASYSLVVWLSSLSSWVGQSDHIVGGVWAVITTIIVSKNSYRETATASVSRIYGTLVSVALCLLYLIFFPFHTWTLALLIGLSGFVTILIGRPGDAPAAAITTAVLIGLAQLSPHEVWRQPIIRLADTVVNAAVGLAAAWVSLRLLKMDPEITADQGTAGVGGDA